MFFPIMQMVVMTTRKFHDAQNPDTCTNMFIYNTCEFCFFNQIYKAISQYMSFFNENYSKCPECEKVTLSLQCLHCIPPIFFWRVLTHFPYGTYFKVMCRQCKIFLQCIMLIYTTCITIFFKNANFSTYYKDFTFLPSFYVRRTAAVAQWVRALAPQAEGWVFESQPRQT